MTEGRFISLEGVEGSGKSIQQGKLCATLRAVGLSCLATREPGGGTPAGEAVRQILMDPACWRSLALAEIYLYAAARADHLEQVIEPALARGEVVVCDRYLDSTFAYQGFGRGRPLELIERLHRLPPLGRRPDLTLLLDLDPAIGLERAVRRNRSAVSAPVLHGYDEADLEFHRRVREGFLSLARQEPGRIRIVDASRPIGQVAREVTSLVGAVLDIPLVPA